MRPRAIAIAAIVLVGAVASCGGDDDPEGTEREATLQSLPGWTVVHPDAAGAAVVSTDGGTEVRLEVEGLEPDSDYTAHVHDAACDADPPGGDHWFDDPSVGEEPSNEIGLQLTTDDTGAGSVTVSSDLVADERAVSVVVHAGDFTAHAGHVASDRVLCGDLVES